MFLLTIHRNSVRFQTTLELLEEFLFRQVMLLLYFAVITLFTSTCIFLATLSCMILVIWSVKIYQLNLIQNCRKKKLICSQHVQWIMRISRKVLIYILEINPIIGRLFVVFLMINYPINCFLLIGAIFGNANSVSRLFIFVICIQQMGILFIFHFVIAKYNSKFVKPNLKTIYIAVHNMNCIAKIINVKLSLFIQTFHSVQQYGITYWKFGLISFSSYLKVCIHYFIELIL